MNISIEFIPHTQHRFTTIGYWFVEKIFVSDGINSEHVDDILHIRISREICWENKIAVLFHELIEAAWCINHAITTEQCDAFDALFEREYEEGKWPKSVEAGMDKRCPYRKGHIWGCRFEWLVLFILGADKKKCDAECDALMGVI